MTTVALDAHYHGEMMDTVDRFHGQQLLNIGWDRHLLFASPLCVPVPPDMPFAALVERVLPALFGAHPDFARIRWSDVRWLRSREGFIPDWEKSLVENGLGHKAVLRMQTPELHELRGGVS